jgi:signal transduction histidine kinase
MLSTKLKGGISVSREFPENPVIIKGNLGKLHQAFLNVFNNALDAVPESNGILSIVAKIKDGKVTIVIGDNGKGISAEDLDRVLDPFYTTKPPGEGTGLGLSITNSIIQDHKGQLEIHSILKRGTEVNITLPIHDYDGN